jgi:hypothetical protein
MKPIPDNVKEILGQLSAPHQVALRGYIATLRSEINDINADLKTKNDPDPNSHFHGDVKVRSENDDDVLMMVLMHL